MTRATKRPQASRSSIRIGCRREEVTLTGVNAGRCSVGARRRRNVARDADDRQAIGAIGCELQRQQPIVEIERRTKVGADFGIDGEHEQARRVVVDAELLRGAEHSRRLDAAHFCLCDRDATGQARTGEGARDFHAGRRIGCAADDLQERSGSRVDAADAQSLGIRMRRNLRDPRDHHPGEFRRGAHRVLDFEAGHRQRVGKAGTVLRRIGERAQPAFGETHRGSRYANCLRKRRSFS